MTNALPALDEATESALRASIQRFGVLVPILVDQHGNLVDGYHRVRIAQEENQRYPKVHVLTLPDDPEERASALADVNDARRPKLSIEQRREIVAHLRGEGHSQRAIAGAIGVSKKTVQKDLSDLDTGIQLPEKVTGTDGKTYNATKEPTKQKEEITEAEGFKTRVWKRTPGEQLANVIENLCGTCAALDMIDVYAAIAAMSPTAREDWQATLTKEVIQPLTRLRKQLKEGE